MKRSVAVCALLLLAGWVGLHAPELVATQNGLIRTTLTLLLGTLLAVRRKASPRRGSTPPWLPPLAAVPGAILAIGGIVLGVRQAEWAGLLLLVYGCLRWALPVRYGKDLLLALFLVYWIHPVPARVFDFLQLGMQRLSVLGAERVLHMLNVRVWADGLVLHTGLRTFEVPAWCSGMRTATTVFLLSLGLAFLRRFRWYETLAVVTLGLGLALVLNVARISAMIALAPRLGPAAGAPFLHDTAGLIVVLGVILVYVEIAIWSAARRRLSGDAGKPGPLMLRLIVESPPFWRWLLINRWLILGSAAAAALALTLLLRNRPHHRVEMMKGVALEAQTRGDLELAERVARKVRLAAPGNGRWNHTLLRILILRGEYGEALDTSRAMPDPSPALAAERIILDAYACLGLGQLDEAEALANRLPAETRDRDPMVAMILAELAARTDEADRAAKHVLTAFEARDNLPRVRALFPYLRARQKWRTIAACDRLLPYHRPAEVFSALEAHMHLNNVPRVAGLTHDALREWPDDARVLQPLFFLANKPGMEEWENRFADHLLRALRASDEPDALCSLFGLCFDLARPDLAWAVYNRVDELDPSHPGLDLCVARHGRDWFRFRRDYLGLRSNVPGKTVDVRLLYNAAGALPAWQEACAAVPLGDRLAGADADAVRTQCLERAVAEFGRRDGQGLLSPRMQIEFVYALEMAGDLPAASARVARLSEQGPEARERARVLRSEIYERAGDWAGVYETLRDYRQQPNPHLQPMLRLIRAQHEQGLGLAALETARHVYCRFPDSSQALNVLCTLLLRHNLAEEVVFLLSRPRTRTEHRLNVLETEALYRTQRYMQAVACARASFLPTPPITPDLPQTRRLPAAEAVLLWHQLSQPSEREFGENAQRLRRLGESTSSPFLRNLSQLWLEACENGCPTPSVPARWEAAGRDPLEKAVALNQLTLLLCRESRFAEARNAAGMAVKHVPDSPLLWQILVSLSQADRDVLRAARERCPSDSQIWLADIVARAGAADAAAADPAQRDAVMQSVTNAVLTDAYTAAAMTRACDYLLRKGFEEHAVRLARHLTDHSRDLLPAYVMAIRCAMHVKDRVWVRRCATDAIAASVNPHPFFYRKLVEAKSGGAELETDAGMVDALKKLIEHEPDNPHWHWLLGCVRFERGGWEVLGAYEQMQAALDLGATNRPAFLIAAESSRLLGNLERAEALLRKALEHYPGDVAVINNLATVLSDQGDKLQEALDYLPALIDRGGSDPRVLDTVTAVYLRADMLDAADRILTLLLKYAEHGTAEWFRTRTRQAEVLLRRGDHRAAHSLLNEALRQCRQLPDADLLEANRVQAEIIAAQGG